MLTSYLFYAVSREKISLFNLPEVECMTEWPKRDFLSDA